MEAQIRAAWAALWMAGIVWAAPPLTTVEDMLYKADGSPFNGIALIEWKSFQAADSSNIATHSVAVAIVNGVLRVELVPTTNASPGAYYQVRYHSDGRVQFDERWAVPPSATPVKLKDIRIAGPVPAGGGTSPPAPSTQIQESDVLGLVEDLAARPVKGPGYAPSRAAVINDTGQIEAVSGNVTDCVRVDGTSGPCDQNSSLGPGFVDGETPAGLINGSNVVFTLGQVPSPPESLALYRNGVLQKASLDFTLSGNTVTFASASTPQVGDVLLAFYRLADAGNPTGAAGGHLTGTFPNPQIAGGVISNINVSDVAGIAESKLALNYPTHSNANDPNAGEKAALAGTSGTPSATNRYVTDQDARMTNARTPSPHALLSASHSDTTAATVVRGDILVATGTPATWGRMPIGPANRCLMSNGFDAVWNTCLYTGFTAGSVPFVDASGNLAQNNTRLYWDNSNRRLSIGNNLNQGTLTVYDAAPGIGVTALAVRAGQGQGSSPLAVWLDASGVELGQVDAAGNVKGRSFEAATAAGRAAWRDAGNSADPGTRLDGDFWYNNAGQARKTAEGGQAHSLPQVICSSTGAGSAGAALTRLGSCTIPANFLKPGDRVDIRFSYSHEGSSTNPTFEVRWGGTTIVSRTAGSSETQMAGRIEAGVHDSGTLWAAESWGAALSFAASAGNAVDSPAQALVIDFLGKLSSVVPGDSVTLRNFTVVRYPAQANP